MIDTDKYKGHTEGPWELILNYEEGWSNTWEGNVHLFTTLGIGIDKKSLSVTDAQLIADAPLLLEEVKRLRKALHIEEQIVQAFYEYREDCCFDHCEAWMLENGHRVVVKIDGDEQSEWKVEVE